MGAQRQLQREGKGGVSALTDAKRVALERGRMLASIERYLSASQREAIQKKLEEENRLMSNMVGAEKKLRAITEKNSLALNPIYFRRKIIDNNIFE